MAVKAITANRLRDGAAVWLGTAGDWVERVDHTAVYEGAAVDAALALARQAERERIVVEPYAIDVELEDGVPVPTRYRELIRARGPSVRTDLGIQADALSA